MSVGLQILIAYATKHGSTRDVADALGKAFRMQGAEGDVRPAAEVHDLEGYDAVVLGGALYIGRWHRDAVGFLERYQRETADLPLAIFAMGPKTLAKAEIAASRAQLEGALSKFSDLAPVAVAIFGGVVDPTMLHFPLSRLPASDACDWDAVAAWAAVVGGLFGECVSAVSA